MTHNADSSLSQISSDILDRLSRHVRARWRIIFLAACSFEITESWDTCRLLCGVDHPTFCLTRGVWLMYLSFSDGLAQHVYCCSLSVGMQTWECKECVYFICQSFPKCKQEVKYYPFYHYCCHLHVFLVKEFQW